MRFARMVVTLALGLSALTGHANDLSAGKVIRTTQVVVHGLDIKLVKYQANGKVCQQYVKDVETHQRVAQHQVTVSLGEVCGAPELRKVADGGEELFPAGLVTLEEATAGPKLIQLPVISTVSRK